MNNIEQNALRIAELKYPLIKGDDPNLHKLNLFGISKRYRTYEGLMPIVFECNKSNIDYPININPHQITAYPGDGLDIYGYNTETEFIEAIQLAVIKYLELMNADKGIP